MGDEDKYTPIVLDGKPRRLLLDLNAMVDFKKATGHDIWSLGEELSAVDLRALLWAGLRHEEETLLQSDVGAMVHMGNLAEVGRVLREAIEKSMPEEKKERKKKSSPLAARRT